MHTRELGTGGLSVSALGLGCMGMSQSYGTGDDEESIRTIQRALDLGVTLVDTADAYARGANETLVGRAIGRRRQGVVLATKFGLVTNPSGPATDVDARPERVKASCEASLSRLGTDVIDLYYLHRVDPNVPIEDTVGAMSELVHEGKVRFLGLSEAGPQSIRRAHRIHPIAALQSEYSLWTRDPERAVLPACRELGIGFVAFSPLGRGFLSGAVKDVQSFEPNDVRRRLPRFQSENVQRNIALVERLEETARAKRCAPSQLALAWLLAKGPDIVPIPGTKRRRYVEENAAADDLELTAQEVAALDEAFPIDVAAGTRYPAESMRLLESSR
ncbi:MAG TPA: aldo/keto reductase [Vicinamibacterales bacterium]|nr:aldo/keto reductase [Vicinamibacterales bacterium]